MGFVSLSRRKGSFLLAACGMCLHPSFAGHIHHPSCFPLEMCLVCRFITVKILKRKKGCWKCATVNQLVKTHWEFSSGQVWFGASSCDAIKAGTAGALGWTPKPALPSPQGKLPVQR